MQISQRIAALKNKTKFEETVVHLMKYFGWTLPEVQALPIPSFLSLIRIVNNIEKEKKNKGKK